LAVAACAIACLALSACESTQDKSARLSKGGASVFQEKGLKVTRQNGDVKVGATSVISDENGTAAVVELENRSKRTLANVPLAIDVTDASGKSVFKNDAPGLEPSLTSVAVLRPGERFMWVDDQVQPTGKPKKVNADVGVEKGVAPAELPPIEVTEPRLEEDPTSGVNAAGFVTNKSKLEQLKFTLFAVALKGGRVVAAGRGAVQRLKPGKRTRFHIYFIGDPRGAKLTVAAPPTVLE
jgi:hypothetical protein